MSPLCMMTRAIGLSYLLLNRSVFDIFKCCAMFIFFYGTNQDR